ncbi:MAG: hypothetical protein JWM86_177 [Thermoleophilia bacterium]|nr:hypothetical protein [Thermoleophilia bacterium]
MGILDNIGKGKKRPGSPAARAQARPASSSATGGAGSAATGSARPRPAGAPGSKGPAGKGGAKGAAASRIPGRKRKGTAVSQKERVQSAAAPLHDRRRRLVGARESTLRDLGGLMLEMYKRNRFREELLLDKCEEVLAIEVEIAHVDQRLFQLAPPNAAGMRPIGRCDCGAPIHPGQNFCGVCGRSFATMTQSRSCTRCGAGLRPGDQFCATCGTEAPDALQTIEAAPQGGAHLATPSIDAATIASSAVSETVVIDAVPSEPTSFDTPPLDAPSLTEDPGPAPMAEAFEHEPAHQAPPAPPVPPVDAPESVATIEDAIEEATVILPPPPSMPAPAPAPAPVHESPAASPTPVLEPISDADLADAIERDDSSFEQPAGPIILDPSAPAPGAEPELPSPAPGLVESSDPAGFDWSAAPASAEPAMDAAVDAIPDTDTGFVGLSLTSSVPPPPIVDPVALAPIDPPPIDAPPFDLPPTDAPPSIQQTDEPELGALSRRLGKDARSFRAPRPDKPAKAEKAPKPAKPAKAEKPAKAPKPAADTSGANAAKAAKAAERAEAKALAAEQKQRAKDAKARAKEKAKAARDSRKRGGGA